MASSWHFGAHGTDCGDPPKTDSAPTSAPARPSAQSPRATPCPAAPRTLARSHPVQVPVPVPWCASREDASHPAVGRGGRAVDASASGSGSGSSGSGASSACSCGASMRLRPSDIFQPARWRCLLPVVLCSPVTYPSLRRPPAADPLPPLSIFWPPVRLWPRASFSVRRPPRHRSFSVGLPSLPPSSHLLHRPPCISACSPLSLPLSLSLPICSQRLIMASSASIWKWKNRALPPLPEADDEDTDASGPSGPAPVATPMPAPGS